MPRQKAIRLALVKQWQLLSERSKMDKRLPALRLPLVYRNLRQLVVIGDNSRKLVPSMCDIPIDRHGAMLLRIMASTIIDYIFILLSINFRIIKRLINDVYLVKIVIQD